MPAPVSQVSVGSAPTALDPTYIGFASRESRALPIVTDLLLLLVGTVLVNNFVLVKFLGLCPFMGVSRQIDSAYGMALATGFGLPLSAARIYLIHHSLLVHLGLGSPRTLAFI